MAVGDDWQSIYAFSGSILPLFTRFCEAVGYGQELKITRTYRNAQEIIDIAGTFVQKNSAQIKRSSSLRNESLIRLSSIRMSKLSIKEKSDRKVANTTIWESLLTKLSKKYWSIMRSKRKSRIASILLIGRYGFDARNLVIPNNSTTTRKQGKFIR